MKIGQTKTVLIEWDIIPQTKRKYLDRRIIEAEKYRLVNYNFFLERMIERNVH
jgi:hypothetical protein